MRIDQRYLALGDELEGARACADRMLDQPAVSGGERFAVRSAIVHGHQATISEVIGLEELPLHRRHSRSSSFWRIGVQLFRLANDAQQVLHGRRALPIDRRSPRHSSGQRQVLRDSLKRHPKHRSHHLPLLFDDSLLLPEQAVLVLQRALQQAQIRWSRAVVRSINPECPLRTPNLKRTDLLRQLSFKCWEVG